MGSPRIAIPEINQDVRNYTGAVAAAGMEPVVISVQSEQMKKNYQQEYLDYSEFRVKAYDGLLIPGGWDINPCRYGEENRGSIMIMDALDELQFSMLDDFVTVGKPVLGICRGFQIINVYFGGTMIQHLSTAFRHFRKLDEPDKAHGCIAAEGSWLAKLYGTKFTHNSAHHQAVDRLGEGLVIDSRCDKDGTVEALHHTSLPIYAVQWHPERMCLELTRDDTVNGLPVFQFFNRVCSLQMESASCENDGLVGEMMGL